METRERIQKEIITFLGLAFTVSWALFFLTSSSELTQQGGPWVIVLPWCPGIAAILTQLLYRKSLRGLGWGWGKTKYQLWSYAIPLAYTLAAYTVVWVTGLGGFPNQEALDRVVSRIPSFPHGALGLLMVATLGIIPYGISALGEEIGWRGLLVPQLAKLTTFSKTALLSGLIWAVWHYPYVVFGNYNNGTPVWFGLTCFTAMIIGISFIFTWFRLKSGSLWTGVLLHASHNLFIQMVFTPLTSDTGITEYVIDEFGIALAIVAFVCAYIVWRNRSELANTGIQSTAVSSG